MVIDHFYYFFLSIRSDVDVSEQERLSNFTLRHKLSILPLSTIFIDFLPLTQQWSIFSFSLYYYSWNETVEL
jgi:hypothetical protein